MAVYSETIEIKLAGARRIAALEADLLNLTSQANAAADAIAGIGLQLEQNRSRVRTLSRIERLSRGTIESNERFVEGAARRASGTPLSTSERRRRQRQSDEARADRAEALGEMRSIGTRTRQLRSDRRRQRVDQDRYLSEYASALESRTELLRELDDISERSRRELRGTSFRSRVRATRSLISARQDDASRLGRSPFIRGRDLIARNAGIERDAGVVSGQIARLEENETATRRLIGTRIGSLMRQRGVARRGGNAEQIRSLNEQIIGLEGNLQAELRESQATRYRLAVDLGRLNQRRRSLSAIGEGRSAVVRGGQSIRTRAQVLEEMGVRASQLQVNVDGENVPVSRVTQRAVREANINNNIGRAQALLKLAANRVTFLERQLKLNNQNADSEQKRLQTLQKFEDKAADLRTANASGERFNRFEQLLGQLQGMRNTRNTPLFNRIASQVSAAAARVPVPKGFMSGPSSPLRGESFIVGSPKNVEARSSSALALEELQQKLGQIRPAAQARPAFQRAEGLINQLPQLLQESRFTEFGSISKDARKAIALLGFQSRQLRKTSELSSETFDTARKLAERSDELLRTGSITQRQRADVTRRLEAAGTARSAGDPEEAQRILRSLGRTVSAQERQARRTTRLEAERQTALTRQTKARNDLEVQERQISQLLGQGAEGLPNFERARSSAQRLPGLLQSRDFNEFNRVLSEATTFARLAQDDIKTRNRYGKANTKYEKDIRAINDKILAGKKVTLEEADKLNKFYELQRGTGQRLALPPAAPGSPAFSGGRLGRAGTETVLGGVRVPRIVERLGGARTGEEAKKAFSGVTEENKRSAKAAAENVKTERKIGEERSKQAAKIVGGVADAGRKIRSLFERDIIDADTYNTFRRQLIGIGKGISSETTSLTRLAGTLRFRSGQISKLEPKGVRRGATSGDPLSRLANLQLDAENQITKLNKLESEGVNVVSRRNLLQAELNKSLQAGYDISEKNLNALRDQVGFSSRFARNERAKLTGRAGGKTGGTQDPQAAQQRLARDLFAGESLVGKLQNLERKRVAGLGAADPKTVEVTQQVVKLETQLNAAKQAGFELTKQNLDALTSTVNKSRQLLELDAQQNKLSAETAKIRRLQGERRLPQLQRDSLTSILGDLGRASSAAKVFRGGRTGEQALSNIIGAFNASTAPPKASPLAQGPTAPRYTGPDAGREMEIDRYRGIFAGLTNNPRFYNRLLQGLPREAITTTMAGRASDISKAVEDAKRPDRKALESSIRLAYEEAVGNIPSAVTELFDKIGSVFDSIVNRVKGGAGGVGGTGGGGGGKPPLPPAAGGPEPEDFAGRVDAARGSADKLLGLKDLADMSGASIKQLQLLSQALSETREGVKMTDKSFGQLTQALNRVDDQIARRDPNADFLTRQFGQRRGQAVGEGLIGGAFPLLFGQGIGASVGGGLGGALGGFAGGTLGFGLSLAGTALGSAFDGVVQAAQDTGNTLRDLVGNFEQIKDSGLLASRSQEKLIVSLLEAGNKTAAYAIIQDELNQKLGADGAAKLREAADAGDRMKRAMADLGVQLQLFVAGPLADFLNRIASAIESRAIENRTQDLLSSLPQEQRGRLQRDLEREARASSPFKGPFAGLFGFDASRAGTQTGGGERSLIPQARLRELIAEYAPFVAAPPQSQSDRSQRAINDAETRQAAAQRELDLFTKTNEGPDILKGFKQQANAIRREQEDIDRQSFELRRDYEKQIEDIRRGVEDKISQLRQENAQKELEILVKQGQIREQQFKNAALAIQNELAGDDLAQSLADAVTTYLGAQLSAQNEIEQRRKQFEIEIGNQQIELEKYKADVARSVAQLNLSTAEKVQEINRSIARRNEDAALNNFAAEKESAKLKLRVLAAELRVLQTKEQTEIEQTRANIQNNPSLREQYILIETAQKKRLQEFESGIERINKKILPEIEGIKPPAKLSEVRAVSAKSVSTAGVSDLVARGTQLQRQILNLSDSLTRINEQGGLEEFIGRITGLAQQSFTELENALNRSRKALGLAGDDFSITQQLIESSYEDLIRSLAKNPEIKLTAELRALLNATEKATIEFEKLRPTIEFYTQANEQAASSIGQTKAEIAELLLPVKEYDKQLAIINGRGGLGVNPEQEQEILRNAKALDELNAKLKALNALRDVASGWTDSFIQLNKELLKGGNLLESVQRFAEGVADRTLDVLLEFTLRPLQDQLFKNLADFIGIKPEQDPLLQPINAVKSNTDKILGAAISLVRAAQAAAPATQAAPAAPANGIRPGPGAISEPPGNYQWYREVDRVGGPSSSAAPMGQFNGIGGPDLPMTGKSIKDALRLTDEEIAAAVNTAIGEYGGSDPLGRTDVFANILSRSRSGRYPSNLVDVVTQPGQYAPNFGLSRAQVINPNRYGADLFSKVKSELLDPALLERSIKDVNGRLYFKGISQYGNMMQGDFLRAEGQNFFHGPGREPGLNPQITSKLLSEINPVATTAQPGVQFNAEVRQEEWLGAFRAGRKEIGAAFDLATTASGEAAVSIDRLAQSADQAATGLEGVGTTMSESVTKFQQIVGTGLQAISSVAMGIGGAQMIRKGGTYNTLMGAASIFGSIGSVAGMFGTGGPLSGLFGGGKSAGSLDFGVTAKSLPLAGLPAYASGGRPEPFMPALIGEEGPELWVPDRPGTIIPNDELYVPGLDDKGGSAPPIGRYSRRAAANPGTTEGSSERSIYSETYERGPGSTTYVGNYGRSVPYQRSETTREIDRLERVTSSPKELPPIKYETTRVNEYEFVTPEQLEASNARTAKIARNQTIRELADSMKTRKRLGL